MTGRFASQSSPNTGVAQSVEHWSPKPGVESSNLSTRANKKVNAMSRFTNYISESYSELVNKVSWPTHSEVLSSSIVVLLASFIIAIVILLMDMLFGQLIMPVIYGTF